MIKQVFALASCCLLGSLSYGAPVTYSFSRANSADVFIQSGMPDASFDYVAGDHGVPTVIEVDKVDGSRGEIQGLLAFNNLVGDGADQITSGTKIQKAILKLYLVNDNKNADIKLYQMTTAWDEASTWNSIGGGIIAGTNAKADGVITANLGSDDPVYVDIDVTSHVQDWLDQPGTNYGWGFVNTSVNGIQFASFEACPNAAPELIVTIPEPASVMLIGLGVLGLVASRRVKRR